MEAGRRVVREGGGSVVTIITALHPGQVEQLTTRCRGKSERYTF